MAPCAGRLRVSPSAFQAAIQRAAHIFRQQLQIPTSFLTGCLCLALLSIFFACAPCFSFRGPFPSPAIWFSFKQSVACAEAAGGAPDMLATHGPLGAGAAVWQRAAEPQLGEEKGEPRKSPRQATHLISSLGFVPSIQLLETVNSDGWGKPACFTP